MTKRREFIKQSAFGIGGSMAAALPLSACGTTPAYGNHPADLEARYAILDEILQQPVLKREIGRASCRERV